MKKFSLLFVLATISISSFSTHYELPQSIWDSIVGNKQLSFMLGGLYKKGDVEGFVYYISEDEKTMKIVPINNIAFGKDLGSKNNLSYSDAVKYLNRGGFRIPSSDEFIAFFRNWHIMKYNSNFEFGWDSSGKRGYYYYLHTFGEYWTNEVDQRGHRVVFVGSQQRKYGEHGIIKWSNFEYYLMTAKDEVWDADEKVWRTNHMNYMGIKEVPFEPQYISNY